MITQHLAEAMDLVRYGEMDGDHMILRGGARETLLVLKPDA